MWQGLAAIFGFCPATVVNMEPRPHDTEDTDPMPVIALLRLTGLCALLLLSACAALPERLALEEPEQTACLDKFLAADRLVENDARHDPGAHRPPDFPWLRSTRFLASFVDELGQDSDRWEAWLTRMSREDIVARRHELANAKGLPSDSDEIEAELAVLADCADTLNEAIHFRPELQDKLIHQSAVPDDYRTAQRWLGVYPITRLFVLSGVNNLHEEQAEALDSEATKGPEANWTRYLAEDALADTRRPKDGRRSSPSALERDALGIPEATAESLSAWFQRHAPIWRLEEALPADRIGRPELGAEQHARVNTDQPVEYRYLSFGRFNGDVVIQLNYMVWLPERPRDGFLDLLGGHLDGAIWRVNLGPDGEVLAGESMHVCGCYYMVFPGKGVRERASQAGGEPIFVGPALPKPGPDERIRLTRKTGSHYLIGVSAAREAADVRLEVRDADELRSLSGAGRHASLYGKNGVVPGSERRERWLLWTMGVPSPGAMRQPGRHAIAFAGRRHFDEPDLLEQSLEVLEPDKTVDVPR